MRGRYATAQKKSRAEIPPEPSPAEIVAELEAQDLRERRKLDDIAFALLNSTSNDPAAAERMLDDFLDLLFESNTLCMYRYRWLLARVRAGL